MPDQNYSEPNLEQDTDHELLFKAAYAQWLIEQGGGGGGSGTVTSVGLSLPSIFTVSGSPVTTTGTLTGALATQAANTVFAGPTTGAAATPTFRALVNADVPSPGNTGEIVFTEAGLMSASNELSFDTSTKELRVGVNDTTAGFLVLHDQPGVSSAISLHSDSGGTAIITPSGLTGNRTYTFPDAGGEVVLALNSVELQNKTISGGANTLSDIALSSLSSQNASTLVGRTSASSGSPTEITLGTGLSMSGTTLNVSGFATLGANTFTRLQTITQGTANEGIIASTGYSLTGANAQNMVDLAGTWNTTGVPTAIKLNITNTASGAGSKLLDLQVGSSSKFFVDTDGYLNFPFSGDFVRFMRAGASSGGGQFQMMWSETSSNGTFCDANSNFFFRFGRGVCAVDGTLGFSAADSALSPDTYIVRDGAADILAMRDGATAQTFRVYGTYTDSSNYVRASLAATSTLVTLAAETAGTGADNVDINLTTAGTGLVNFANQSPTTEAVASDTTMQIKVGGTTYKVLLRA